MGAVANHVKYEGLIVRSENIEGRLTLFVANTREETDINVCTIRLKPDREQTDTVKGVLY